MQGRKPKPTHLKLISGNPGRRPLKVDEFRPAVAIPRAPAHVRENKEAFKEWKRVTVELAQHGLIALVDRADLTFYVVNWARHVEAEEMIEKAAKTSGSGLFVMTPNKFPVQSPWLAVSNRAMEFCWKFLTDFGMSPSARTRVTPSDPQLAFAFPEESKPAGGFHAL